MEVRVFHLDEKNDDFFHFRYSDQEQLRQDFLNGVSKRAVETGPPLPPKEIPVETGAKKGGDKISLKELKKTIRV